MKVCDVLRSVGSFVQTGAQALGEGLFVATDAAFVLGEGALILCGVLVSIATASGAPDDPRKPDDDGFWHG